MGAAQVARARDARSLVECRLANGTRAAVDAWDLKLLCQEKRWQSDSLTVISVPKDIDSADVVTYAFAKHNLTIGVGLGQASLQPGGGLITFRPSEFDNCHSSGSEVCRHVNSGA